MYIEGGVGWCSFDCSENKVQKVSPIFGDTFGALFSMAKKRDPICHPTPPGAKGMRSPELLKAPRPPYVSRFSSRYVSLSP